MGDAENTLPQVNGAFTATQLDALARVLERSITRGNMFWLATDVLGTSAEQELGNAVGANDSVRRILEIINERGKMSDAIRKLVGLTHANTFLMVALKRFLRGEDVSDEQLQKLLNDYEPFLSSKAIREYYPKVLRTVCAVALGDPENDIMGSGFLVGPDLVMTNFHVIEPFLKIDDETKKVMPNGPGNQLFFFFDYLSTPTPDVPPLQVEGVEVVTAAEDWLVHGRAPLQGDGTKEPQALSSNPEYDYVVVRLAKRIGALSPQKGGGGKRGWLELSKEKIDTVSKRKILVFQHPQKAPQQWDVGDFVRLDKTESRVWYQVSTAHGSSGGAAVDSQGRLYALHNAEVKDPLGLPADTKVNQGVRIDKIAEDLQAEAPDVLEAKTTLNDSTLYWSLSDNPKSLSPIVGRTSFRNLIIEMLDPTSPRVLVVRGAIGSGRKYSTELLRHTLGVGVPVALFRVSDLEKLKPKPFLKVLATELRLSGPAAPDPPEALTTENLSRWIQKDLPKWLLERLEADEQKNRSKYPAWVVIETIKRRDDRVKWADNLEDCIAALVGAHDQGTPAVEIPQLRWLFLASMTEVLPTGGVPQKEDDLSQQEDYGGDFAACFKLAYNSVDKEADLPEPVLRRMANSYMAKNDQLTAKKRLAKRKLLSDLVLDLMRDDPNSGV
jgi:V8-like Glu-specific endopeptidase